MTIKIDTIVRLLSCLYVFSDVNDLMKKYRTVAKNNIDLIDAPNPQAVNELFAIGNTVTSIYFRDEDKKTSALFITYDSESDEMHVHFVKHLKDVILDYDVFKYHTSGEYYYSADINAEKNIRRILSSLSVDLQNIYYARNSKDFPAYVLKSMTDSGIDNNVCLTKDEANDFIDRVNAYNHSRIHSPRSKSFCARQSASFFPRLAF